MRLRALTLWQPWAWAIIEGHKDIENRSWAPGVLHPGDQFLIHAGSRFDDTQTWADIQKILNDRHGDDAPRVPTYLTAVKGAIVGVVELDRVVYEGQLFPDPALESPWFCGPYGWVLTNPIKFDEPIYTRGFQKLWHPPAGIMAEVEKRMNAAEWGVLEAH